MLCQPFVQTMELSSSDEGEAGPSERRASQSPPPKKQAGIASFFLKPDSDQARADAKSLAEKDRAKLQAVREKNAQAVIEGHDRQKQQNNERKKKQRAKEKEELARAKAAQPQPEPREMELEQAPELQAPRDAEDTPDPGPKRRGRKPGSKNKSTLDGPGQKEKPVNPDSTRKVCSVSPSQWST